MGDRYQSQRPYCVDRRLEKEVPCLLPGRQTGSYVLNVHTYIPVPTLPNIAWRLPCRWSLALGPEASREIGRAAPPSGRLALLRFPAIAASMSKLQGPYALGPSSGLPAALQRPLQRFPSDELLRPAARQNFPALTRRALQIGGGCGEIAETDWLAPVGYLPASTRRQVAKRWEPFEPDGL